MFAVELIVVEQLARWLVMLVADEIAAVAVDNLDVVVVESIQNRFVVDLSEAMVVDEEAVGVDVVVVVVVPSSRQVDTEAALVAAT